jgi:hypothetical protein
VIALAKDMRAAAARGEKFALSDDQNGGGAPTASVVPTGRDA